MICTKKGTHHRWTGQWNFTEGPAPDQETESDQLPKTSQGWPLILTFHDTGQFVRFWTSCAWKRSVQLSYLLDITVSSVVWRGHHSASLLYWWAFSWFQCRAITNSAMNILELSFWCTHLPFLWVFMQWNRWLWGRAMCSTSLGIAKLFSKVVISDKQAVLLTIG